MTEEQIEQITKLLQEWNVNELIYSIIASLCMITAIILTFLLYKALKQKKEIINQYYLTLNDEQKKVIDTYKELDK